MKEYQNWLKTEEAINRPLTEEEKDLTHSSFKAALEYVFDELDRVIEEVLISHRLMDISELDLSFIIEELEEEK